MTFRKELKKCFEYPRGTCKQSKDLKATLYIVDIMYNSVRSSMLSNMLRGTHQLSLYGLKVSDM